VSADAKRAGDRGEPHVYCVVLNWNGWRDTVSCLQSLAAQDYASLTTVVVDNASTDDSVAKICEAFPEIELLQSDENRGFAAGCNLGIRHALRHRPAFVWLLNNDTVAPPDTTRKLVAAADGAKVGVVGSVLRYLKNPAKIQAWGGGSVRRWMGFVRHYHSPAKLGPTSFMTFASVLLRREMLESVGLLDEGYFMYFEDADFCYRATEAGWELAVAEDTNVLHREGGSAGSAKSARIDRIVTASGLRFLDHYGRPRSVAKVLFVLSRLGKRAMLGNLVRMKAVRRGMRDWRYKEPMSFMEEG